MTCEVMVGAPPCRLCALPLTSSPAGMHLAHAGPMTDTNTTPDTTAVTAGYLAAWNADDPAERRRQIEAAWTPDHHFTDPLTEVSGYDALDAFIDQVRGTYPGSVFSLVSTVDVHHDIARWSWEMVLTDGTVRAVGHDSVRLAADGRISDFLGFFGPLEPTAAP